MNISDTIALWCPLEPWLHPDWRSWERSTVDWMERFGLETEQKETGRLGCIIAGELAARTVFEPADPRGGQFSADSLLWLFAFDDAYCDEGRYSHSPDLMAILVAELIRIAETGRTTSKSPLARALADLRQRLDVLTTPVFITRWVHAVRGYLGYQTWEAAHRSLNLVPTLDDYAVARIRNGSMEICCVTLAIAEGYEVAPQEMDRSDVRALTEMACTLVGWDNDIASYFKEHSRTGDKLNLVDVIAHNDDLDTSDALLEAIRYRDAVQALFIDLRARVEPTVSMETRRYIKGLALWIRGNLDWSVTTARYRRPDRSTIVVVEHLDHAIAEVRHPAGVEWWWQELANAAAAA